MTIQLIPQDVLEKADKILFVAHLALGDFTYMEACFRAFHERYPEIEMHIWVDELRRTIDFRQWEALRNYSLFSWLEAVPYFRKVYRDTYSPFVFLHSLLTARFQRYPIVVAFGLSHRTFYARLVRRIAGNGFVAAIDKRYKGRKSRSIFQRIVFNRLNARLKDYPENATHVSDIYAAWFGQLFGLEISPLQRLPNLEIPPSWQQETQSRLAQWGVMVKSQRQKKLIFVNHISKQAERSWSVEKALELIAAMRRCDGWQDCDFVLNTVPEKLAETRNILASLSHQSDVHLFSAVDNFFQLPAILQQSDLIISVETAVMHLANAVKVPVIALMRQHTPEWVPIDADNSRVIMTDERDDWVQEISIDKVISTLPNPGDMRWSS